MKKFDFRLQRVLDIKETIEEVKRREKSILQSTTRSKSSESSKEEEKESCRA